MSDANPYAAPDSSDLPPSPHNGQSLNIVRKTLFVAVGFYSGVAVFVTILGRQPVGEVMAERETHAIGLGVMFGHLVADILLCRWRSTPPALSFVCGIVTVFAVVSLVELIDLRPPGQLQYTVALFGSGAAGCTALLWFGAGIWKLLRQSRRRP